MAFFGTEFEWKEIMADGFFPCFRNEHRDFHEEVARLRVLRGKQRKNMRLMYPKRMPELAPCCKPAPKK